MRNGRLLGVAALAAAALFYFAFRTGMDAPHEGPDSLPRSSDSVSSYFLAESPEIRTTT
jgi:hypothetical protein